MKTYFRGEFSSRRPITIGVAVVLILSGLSLGMIWLPQVTSGWNAVASAFQAVLFSFAFLGGGLFLLFQIVKSKKTSLLITSEGVFYGAQRYRWEDITEIGVISKYARRNDLYCATRLHPFAVELPISNGLDSKEIKALFEALNREVRELHPHIHLSGSNHDEHIG